MALSHERLEVDKAAIEFISWTQPLTERLPAKVSARDQLERASTSIALNIAKGNGKFSNKDRLRFWQIAQASADECSACLDVLVARQAVQFADVQSGETQIESIVRMMMGLRKRFLDEGGSVMEEDWDYDLDLSHD